MSAATVRRPASSRKEPGRPARWAVQCSSFTTRPHAARESAERLLERIEAQGDCRDAHRVVEVSG